MPSIVLVRKCLHSHIVGSLFLPITLMLNLAVANGRNLPTRFIDSLNTINEDNTLTDQQKLVRVYELKRQAGPSDGRPDTVYAAILLNVGRFEYRANGNYPTAIQYTLESLQANSGKTNNRSPALAMNAYYNLGYYYNVLLLYQVIGIIKRDSRFIITNSLPLSPGIDQYLFARLYHKRNSAAEESGF